MGRLQTLHEKAKNDPGSLKFNELCRLAVAAGFVHKRTNGDHFTYKHSTIRTIDSAITLVPGPNGTVKPYLVRKILVFIKDHNIDI